MKKRELIIIGLLIVSLWINVSTLNRVQDQIHQLQTLRSELNQLDSQLTHMSNEMAQSRAEKEWIQKTNFTLNIEGSREDRMAVRGEWTFREITANQKLMIFYREQGTTIWAKEVLEPLGGLNYAVEIMLSPEKKYEYQITAEGSVSTGSTISPIPQNVYGFPEKKISLSMTPVQNSSKMTTEVFVGFAPAPIDSMNPVNVSIQMENNGQIIKTFPLSKTGNGNNEYSGHWELNNDDKVAMSSDTEFFVITEFKNGVVLKEKTNIIRYGEHTASQRILSEQKTYEEKK